MPTLTGEMVRDEVENAFFWYKSIVGKRLRARSRVG
jgi:hypothetical protein